MHPLDIFFYDMESKHNFKENVKGVLHIGAHKCEEIRHYLNWGLDNSKIIWVEANPNLVENILKKNRDINIKNFICCDEDNSLGILHVTNNGASSSILELGTHANLYKNIKYTHDVKVEKCRLDTMYKKYNISNDFANFLNIDIQGAELLALKGLGDLIYNYDYIYCEVNKNHVYKECALVEDIDEYLKKYNMERVGTQWAGNEGWGDALYIKK